jgi:hypothetical protein
VAPFREACQLAGPPLDPAAEIGKLPHHGGDPCGASRVLAVMVSPALRLALCFAVSLDVSLAVSLDAAYGLSFGPLFGNSCHLRTSSVLPARCPRVGRALAARWPRVGPAGRSTIVGRHTPLSRGCGCV